MKKMTAKVLEGQIREGLKKHGLTLGHDGYHADGVVCAIGGALAYAAASREDLDRLLATDHELNRASNGHTTARAAAKILNHGLTPRDMVMLEAGYENYPSSPYSEDKNATGGFRNDIPRGNRNSYYRLGAKLRAESSRVSKPA